MIGISCKEPDWINFLSNSENIQRAGFSHIEFCIYDMENTSCLFNDTYLERVKNLILDFGFTASVHMIQGINLAEKIPRLRQASIDILKDTIRIASKLNAEWVTVHIGSAGFSDKNKQKKQKRLQFAVEALQQVENMLVELNVKLALENLPIIEDGQQKCKIGSSAEEFTYLFNILNNERFGMIFDIGHANINKPNEHYMEAFLNEMENHVVAYHVHFNNGIQDEHYSLQRYENEAKKHIAVLKSQFSHGLPFIFESYSFSEDIESLMFLQKHGIISK